MKDMLEFAIDAEFVEITDLQPPRSPDRGGYEYKRAADLILSLLLLPLFLPLMAVLWCLIRMDGGPGLFGHRRIGRHGQIFTCWKLRTMVAGAEEKLALHLASDAGIAAEWAQNFKLAHDPRVTRLGQFLRKTSLDELPQIWNVIRGEMSLVGPRPVTPLELEKYGIYRAAYQSMRPGISGLWQVQGRNDVDYATRVRLDVEYLDRASLVLDAWIIGATALTVLRRTGK